MTYFSKHRQLQKDLYIKKDLDIQNSTTPWVPQRNIIINSIKVKAYTTPTGTGLTTIRIYKNRTESDEEIIADLALTNTQSTAETSSSFIKKIDSGEKITYSITTTTSIHPGSDAIISFNYENE